MTKTEAKKLVDHAMSHLETGNSCDYNIIPGVNLDLTWHDKTYHRDGISLPYWRAQLNFGSGRFYDRYEEHESDIFQGIAMARDSELAKSKRPKDVIRWGDLESLRVRTVKCKRCGQVLTGVVGIYSGDPTGLTQDFIRQIERHDKQCRLQVIKDTDKSAFVRRLAEALLEIANEHTA